MLMYTPESGEVSFTAKAGSSYLLHISGRRSSMKLEVDGASIAYGIDAHHHGSSLTWLILLRLYRNNNL